MMQVVQPDAAMPSPMPVPPQGPSSHAASMGNFNQQLHHHHTNTNPVAATGESTHNTDNTHAMMTDVEMTHGQSPAANNNTTNANNTNHNNNNNNDDNNNDDNNNDGDDNRDDMKGNNNTAKDEAVAQDGISTVDIQTVQNLIERCLQIYLTKDEVTTALKEQATVDPSFTELIWTKLEEQNPEFFRCYYTRLKLKAQIIMFNHLLEQQVSVVQKMQRGWGNNNNNTAHGGKGVGVPGSSATASGIPLFQSANTAVAVNNNPAPTINGTGTGLNGAAPHPHTTSHHHDQVVPGAGTSTDFPFNIHMQQHVSDSIGTSPLFNTLTLVSSDHDLAALSNALPTPGELHNPLGFLPTTSPLNLPRNFSLSDLGLDGGGKMTRNFSFPELVGADALEGFQSESAGGKT